MNLNPHRRFLFEVLQNGLALELVSPDDVLDHLTPEVLAHHLPIALKAKLLQASLNAARMTPKLVVEVVGVEALAEHAPLPILWACVRVCAARALQGQADEAVGSGVSAAATAVAVPGNGNLTSGTITDDMQLRPPKAAARPMAVRPGSAPPRISTLSPRSQVLRRGQEPASGPVPNGAVEPPRDDTPDFEIVEESEVPTRMRTAVRSVAEDDTRPGSKT